MRARKPGKRPGSKAEVRVEVPPELAAKVRKLSPRQRKKVEELFRCTLVFALGLPEEVETKMV